MKKYRGRQTGKRTPNEEPKIELTGLLEEEEVVESTETSLVLALVADADAVAHQKKDVRKHRPKQNSDFIEEVRESLGDAQVELRNKKRENWSNTRRGANLLVNQDSAPGGDFFPLMKDGEWGQSEHSEEGQIYFE